MLIMPTTDVNFQALAENITNDFFSNGTPLADGIVKVAKEHEFTPEEVTRLVEKTNTAASIHLLKTAEDKKATFTLAQLELVLQQTHPASDTPIEKTASVYKGIPHTKKLRTHAAMEKAASEAVTEKNANDYSEPVTIEQAVFTLNKAIDEKRMQKIALEQAVQDKIDYLASEFNTWHGPSFSKYASDCQAVYGNKCLPVLEGLAKYLRTTLEKTASDEIVDDRTELMQAMKTICNGLTDLVKLGSEIGDLEKKLGIVWKSIEAYK